MSLDPSRNLSRASRTKRVDISLLDKQAEFVFCEARFPLLVAGFGAGKTQALVTRAIVGKTNYPSQDRAYFAPTWDLIKLIAWPRFEELLDRYKLPYRLHRGERVLQFWHGGKIIFRSLEAPERIIGFEVADCDVDELDTLQTAKAKNCWHHVIARARQRKPDGRPNTVAVGGTPEGFRFLYERWGKDEG